MGSHHSELNFLLPRGWTRHVKSAMIHAISFATTALVIARGKASRSRSTRQHLTTELDRVNTEIALLREELAIKDSRWGRFDPICGLEDRWPVSYNIRFVSRLRGWWQKDCH